jgi:hypothetical protein
VDEQKIHIRFFLHDFLAVKFIFPEIEVMIRITKTLRDIRDLE